MEVVGIAFATLGIFDQAMKRISAIHTLVKSSKDIGRSIIRAETALAAEKTFFEFWIQKWEQQLSGSVANSGTNHPCASEERSKELQRTESRVAVIVKVVTEMSEGIKSADAILRKYDPRPPPATVSCNGGGTLDNGKLLGNQGTTITEDSQSGIQNVLVKENNLRTLFSTVTESNILIAKEIQRNIKSGKKLSWSRCAQRELDDTLKLIKRARERLIVVSSTLDNPTPPESNPKPLDSGNVTPVKLLEKIRRAATSFYNTLPEKNVQIELALVENRTEVPDLPAYVTLAGKVVTESIKFPIYVHPRQQNQSSSKFAVIESLDIAQRNKFDDATNGTSRKRAKPAEDATASIYRVEMFEDDDQFHIMHSVTVDIKRIPPQTTLASLLEHPPVLETARYVWKRLELAHLLALSVLHFYDTGWLRNSLCSHDIMLYGSSKTCLSGKGTLLPVIRTPSEPLKVDANGSIISDIRERSFAALYENDPLRQLFPSSLFDNFVHDLGLILLEIGFEKPLHLLDIDGSEYDDATLLTSLRNLAERTKLGRSFKELIRLCLDVEFGPKPEVAFFDKVVSE